MSANYVGIPPDNVAEFETDCMKWRGRVLTGKFRHWCFDWDGLVVDETCGEEFDCCTCFTPEQKATVEVTGRQYAEQSA